MPKKQCPQNAFAFFMQTLRSKQGRNIRSMAEAAEVAGPLWAQMSAQQRKPYEDMANRAKNSKGKMTSTGRDVELLQQEEDEQQEKIARMRADIGNIIDDLHEAEVLDKTIFFIIHINSFCYYESKDRWFPAEIACVGFSLREGVQKNNVFHRFIKPGMLPIGYGSTAKQHASQTHQLEVPSSDENNCQEVFADLIEFLEESIGDLGRPPTEVSNQLWHTDESTISSKQYCLCLPIDLSERSKGTKPIVYVNENRSQMVTDVIEMWCADYNFPLNTILVYNLQYFFTVLRNKCAGTTVWFSDSFSTRELEKDLYDFSPKLACEYHEVTALPVYCSRSIVVRSAHIICDNCCPSLNIKVVSGIHVPLNTKKVGIVQKVESASNSVIPSKKTAPRSSRDDDSSTIKSYGRSEWETQSYSSTLDDFQTAGESSEQISKNYWDKYDLNTNDSRQMSYAGAMSGVRTNASGYQGMSQASISAGVGNLSLRDNEDFPHLGFGRGVRKGRVAQGRGSVYDKKHNN